ncbi:histidinol-phosphate transaminase [Candidatus Parvarchaeota archaeon]|nr:histidinol-phosphate transaminase [Candidatus Parvarchaeota archaeon]
MGKKIDIEKLARKAVAQLEPYTCARDLYKTAEAFMDANENAFGCSFGGRDGKAALEFGVELNRYPDSDQNRLRDEIARYACVKRENILVGNGSDEIIDLCVRAFVEPGENIISVEPGYSMYGVCAKAQGGIVRQVLLDSRFQPNVGEIIGASDEKTKIVFLVSPNSPVGAPVEKATIEELAGKTNAILFVDEAYVEFGGESVAALVDKYENLIVSRTFSKAWGLAGLRVGYAIASVKTIALLRGLKPPYNVNSLSAALVTKALAEGRGVMEENVAKMRKEREKLRGGLEELGFIVYPTVCNFLLARPPLGAKTAKRMQQEIAAKGMIIRDRSSMPMLQNTFRITIGTEEENGRLIECIRGIVSKGGGYDCVLFDMDGVLVDVRNSYRVAIEKTANEWFARNGGRERVSQKEVSAIKSIPGFNNDWDAAFAIVRARGSLELIKSALPLSRDEKESKLYLGLKEVFQEFYLNGLMQCEPALVAKETLAKLSDSGLKIGIVTGRPKAEAEFAVKNNGWESVFPFSCIVALENCDEEKPSPKPLLLAAKKLGAKNPIYIGDNVSDLKACKAAGIPCVIVGKAVAGDWNVEKTDEIVRMLGR